MKVQITLTKEQKAGIVKYLEETNGDGKKITKQDIDEYIKGLVENSLQSEAVNQYIQ